MQQIHWTPKLRGAVAAVLALAAAGAAAWSFVDPSRALWVAVSVLIVTCPCALSLAVPASLLAATGALARRGVLLRRLDAIDTLSRVTHVFLDKTGTVTEDALTVHRVVPFLVDAAEPVSLDDLVARAAALARWSAHPLARALAATHEDALVRGLVAREIAGAGLDVYENEPAINPKLVELDSVVVLPHMGSATLEGRIAMGEKVIINVKSWVDGHSPPDRVLATMF